MARWLVMLVGMAMTVAGLAQPPEDAVTLAVTIAFDDGTPYTRPATVRVTRPGEGLGHGFERPTRADGAYVFLGLTPGPYEVSTFVLEYMLTLPAQQITVRQGDNTCRIALPHFPTLSGALTPAVKDGPAPKTVLGFVGNELLFSPAPTTVKDGAYMVPRRPADTTRFLLLTDVGYALLDFAPPKQATDDLRIPLALLPGGTATIRVTDGAGDPTPNAVIRLSRGIDPGTSLVVELQTDAEGQVVSPHLPPGDWGYTVRAAGLRTALGRLTITAGKTAPLQAALMPGVLRPTGAGNRR